MKPMVRRVAIVGAGWAGLAAAVHAAGRGHAVTVFEAARQLGGRARGLPLTLPDGRRVQVDNGQHILIGAYTNTLHLMRTVGVDPDTALLRLPLALPFPDGSGLRLPRLPAPLDAGLGILTARGWRWAERLALLRAAARWQRAGFDCDPALTVAALCAGLPPRLRAEFIEPLCVSALNTPADKASAQVFLRVLHDGLFAVSGGSNLLLPRVDLGALFPDAAADWLRARGAQLHLGQRIEALHWQAPHWRLADQPFDAVILAASAPGTARLLQASAAQAPEALAAALDTAASDAAELAHQAIGTVYAQAAEPARPGPLLPAPMLALRATPEAPAQFVFDRDAITRPDTPTRLLAFVVSASSGERAALEAAVAAQARAQLGVVVQPLRTVTEKRATFACTPGLRRPARAIAPGLQACGDHVEGPYPATLEGAVRSGLLAAQALG